MAQDSSPLIDPAVLKAALSNYIPSYANNALSTNPSAYTYNATNADLGKKSNKDAFGLPKIGGMSISASEPSGLGMLADLLGIFGGDSGPTFKPYLDDNGMWQWWQSPDDLGNVVNPVPVTNIPGATQNPSQEYQTAAQNVRAIQDLMPYMSNAANQANLQAALGQLQTSQITSAPMAQLMTELYNTYGSQLNAIGNEISRRNALSQAETDKEVISGPGKDLVKGAYDLSQVYDKPYYDTRAVTGSRINDLLNSIDISGKLTDTERSEIEKGLARENIKAGTAFTPSQTNVVANASRYGEAGRTKQLQSQGALSAAINSAASFLPTAKSGVDVFQVATGKSSMPNSGNGLFTGLNQNNTGNNMATGMLGNMSTLNSLASNERINQANIDANKKDWLDQLNQFTGALGNLGSAAGGFMSIAKG